MKYRLLLVLAALIWGSAFVAQVVGMDPIGPFTFGGVRFLLGSASLLPIIYMNRHKENPKSTKIPLWAAFLMTGLPLFAAATIQQVGLQFTTASKASFLTANYILLVPFFGLFLGHPLRLTHLVGAVTAITGVYLMSIKSDFTISPGDLMMLLCAIFFSLQILALDYLTQRFDPVLLSSGQFFVTGILNLVLAFMYETPTWTGIEGAMGALLYTGILSSGVAYTLQAVGQKYMPPTEASMILSLEMVFGGLSGVLFLGDTFTERQMAGIAAMCIGVFVSQLPSRAILRLREKPIS